MNDHKHRATAPRRSSTVVIALSLLLDLVVAAGSATAGPSALTRNFRMMGWRGTHFVAAAVPGPAACIRATCDEFRFALDISDTYWRSRSGGVRVWIRWAESNDDFDLYVYRRGQLLGSSATRGSPSESVFLREANPGMYRAVVVPVMVTDASYGGIAHLKVLPSRVSGDTFQVPGAIASDCARDVTAELLAWIDSVPDDSILAFGRRACYRIDGSLRIDDRWGLVFEGNGATFRAMTEGDDTRRHFWFFGGGELSIRNLTVRGANPFAGLADEAYRPDREAQHAFALQGVQGAVLDNVRAYDVYGDFVYIAPDVRTEGGALWSRDVTVQNSWFERNGRQGITIDAVEGATIRWNYLGEMRRATFDMEPTGRTWGAREIHIFNNVTGRGRSLWFADAGAGFNISNIFIRSNLALFMVAAPIVAVITPEGGLRGPFYIEDNDFIVGGSPRPGFEFTRTSGAYVTNNRTVFPASRAMTAVALFGSNTVRVSDNTFTGAGQVLVADAESYDYLEFNNRT